LHHKSVEAAADVAGGVTISLRITLSERPPAEPAMTPTGDASPIGGLRGTVTDSAGRPVEDVDVGFIDDSTSVRTDGAGRFSLPRQRVTTGVLRARRLGYRAAYVSRRTDDTSAVTVVLQSVGQQLGTVRVRANWDNKRLEEMQRRRMYWGGTHILRDEIERRDPFRISDMLQGRAGIRVRRDRYGNGVVAGRGDCPMAILVNGFPVRGLSVDEVVSARDVVAVEAYNSALNTPADLAVLASGGCGVLAVWTR
jgi:hypothetical protein